MTKLSLEQIRDKIEIKSFKVDRFDQLMGNKKSQLYVNLPVKRNDVIYDLDTMGKTNTLYVHIPFCTGICTYCAYVTKSAKIGDSKIDRYLEILEKEFQLYNHKFGRMSIKTAYIGGGTPTIMNQRQLERLYDMIRKNFDLAGIEEYTLEGCPETMTENKVQQGKDNGINRISIGVESFNDYILEKMNRRHNSKQSMLAIEKIKSILPIDIDIIRCYPGYTDEMVLHDINCIRELLPSSVTTYKYNLKPSSIDIKKNNDLLTNKQVIDQTMLYYTGLKITGYIQHNIDWFVRKDKHKFKHQMYKWTHDANQISLGVGSYGYIGHTQYYNHKSLTRYSEAIQKGILPIDYCQSLRSQEIENKKLMFALRDTVDIKMLGKTNQDKIMEMQRIGLGKLHEEQFTLNDTGKLYIDQIQNHISTDEKICSM